MEDLGKYNNFIGLELYQFWEIIMSKGSTSEESGLTLNSLLDNLGETEWRNITKYQLTEKGMSVVLKYKLLKKTNVDFNLMIPHRDES